MIIIIMITIIMNQNLVMIIKYILLKRVNIIY